MEKEDVVMMEKEDESHHSSVLVFYDTELSKKTITQLGAVCSAGEFNRWMIPEGEFVYDWGATKFSTKVTAKVDPSDQKLKLFHTEDKVFLPTVFCNEGFNDFLLWLEQMKKEARASSVTLLSWSNVDHGHLISNLVSNGGGLKEKLVEVQGEKGKLLDAQLIVKRLIEPEKTNLGFVFKKLLPNEEFSEHNALEDARATYKVYEEVKSLSSLDDTGMTKLCPTYDPRRDQAVKNVLSKVLDSVVQSSRAGWLETTIDKAVSDMDNLDKLLSSHVLKEAVIEIQDKHKTSEVERMLSKLTFSDEDVAEICEDPFKNLKPLVDDLKVQINKGKGKNSPTSVKLSGHERIEFRKGVKVEEAKRSAAIGLLWYLLKEEKVKKPPQS